MEYRVICFLMLFIIFNDSIVTQKASSYRKFSIFNVNKQHASNQGNFMSKIGQMRRYDVLRQGELFEKQRIYPKYMIGD